jgi:hypothetical protein
MFKKNKISELNKISVLTFKIQKTIEVAWQIRLLLKIFHKNIKIKKLN